MEIAKRQSNLSRIELDPIFAKPALLWQMLEQFTALHELHYKVYSCLRGENLLHGYYKWMLHL